MTGHHRGAEPRAFLLFPLKCGRSDTVRGHRPHPRRHIEIVGGEHTALTGGDVFSRKEGKTANSKRADLASAPGRTEGFGAVFDQEKLVLLAQLDDVVHGAGLAAEMNDNDRFRARRQAFLDVGGGNVAGRRVHVAENGDRTAGHDHIGGRNPGHGRDNDLAANAVDLKRKLERGGAGIQRHGVCNAQAGTKSLFELMVEAAMGEPAILEDRGDRVSSSCPRQGRQRGTSIEPYSLRDACPA